MDIYLIENSEVGAKGTEISQYCLGLPTVLRQVLEQFSTSDLIELSLVNKLWNFEARNVMRGRGNLRANISKGALKVNPCERLAAFASDLEAMQVVPFSGIHLPIFHPVECELLPGGSFHASYQLILERLHWKHLSVRLFNRPDRCQKCPALALVKQILEENCGVLVELILGFRSAQFLGPIFQDLTLPRLKSLAIESWNFDSDSLTSSFEKTLASSAPNLQELQVSSTTVDVMVYILERRPKFAFRPLFKSMGDGLVDSVRLDEMEIRVQRDEIDIGWLCTFMPKLLEASRSTLKSLRMDLLFALPLMCYEVCLENVTMLEIHLSSYRLGELEPSFLELPTGLDFTRVFPKLTQVTVWNNEHGDDCNLDFSSAVMNEFFEEGAAVLSKALPDRATNIKHLDLERCGAVEDATLVLLAQIFPGVKTVRTKREHKGASFIDLWEHFLWLEDVIESDNTHLDIDFDANVLEGSSAVLVPLTPFNPLRNRVCESLIGALRLETIEVYRTEVAISDATLNRLIPILLKTHLTSLKTLRMDLLFAVPLMCYGICLENVTKLIIRLDCNSVDSLEPPILGLPKRLDFNRLFPKLNNVEIECDFDLTLSTEQISPFVEQGKAMLQDGQLDEVVNKKPLTIRGHMLDTTVSFLAQIFPDIQKISLEKHSYPSRMPFAFLWDHFKRLTEFEFISTMCPEWCENLDSDFCGIFEEEAAELREKDDEYLKAVNIVPVRPSMTCLNELRTFTFQYTPETYWSCRKDSLPFCFSKVTGWIVFARCPALAVTFQTSSSQCAKALRHMEPFVTFTSVNT